jgi:surfeit locus 1 family protein
MTIAAFLGVALTLALGRWQLSRAAQKESLQTAIDSQSQRAPFDNLGLATLTDPAAAVHRLITLRGTWVIDKTIFLDNRQMNAKPGFFVVTPMMVENTTKVVLVQRGWVARNFNDRARVPALPSVPGIVEIKGRIAPPPPKLLELGDAGTGAIRQNLDMAQFSAETGLALMPVSIVQMDSPSDGLLREWPAVAVSASKNYGYAFQWFGLSLLITLLYGWFQIGKRFFSRQGA